MRSPWIPCWVLVVGLFVATGCSSVTPQLIRDRPAETQAEQAPRTEAAQHGPRTGGELFVVSVDPPVNSTLTESSVIQAIFEYHLVNIRNTSTYVIAPFFSDKAGDNRTFNALKDLKRAVTLKESGGRVGLRYPIRAEWVNTKRLARPPVIWFELLELDVDTTARVIAKVGPFQYE